MKRIGTYVGKQHGHPTGIVGRMVGERMIRQHVPETSWTISLLDLKMEDQVLEIGFGAGRAIELVAAQVAHGYICGIDLSQEMVRSASRRNTQAIKAGRISLCQGDVTMLSFADNIFDKVFSIQTFYFWPDPQRAMAEIFRVLKAGGTLVVTLSTGSTRSIDDVGERWLRSYQTILEEQIIPGMKQLSFTTASIEQGPYSREFKTTAVVGMK